MDNHDHWTDLENAKNYSLYRPPYEDVVVPWAVEYYGKEPPFPLAVDVGCGPGQLTASLSPHCEQVVGLDISDAMLTTARSDRPRHNVEYRNGSDKDLSKLFSDGSVDLIMAGLAFQFFDTQEFLAQVEKVLKPGGILALVGYMPMGFEYRGREDLRLTMDEFYRRKLLPDLFVSVESVFNLYADIQITFKNTSYKKQDFTVQITRQEIKGIFMSNPHLFVNGEADIDDFVSSLPKDDTLSMIVTAFGQFGRK